VPQLPQASKERILTTAEHLFGQLGFPSASLRQITEEAGVNLAAVNYYFGSKEELYKQVLLRRIHPMNDERLDLLAQAQQLAGDQPVPLRAILVAFIRPMLRRSMDASLGGTSFLRLLSRELMEPQPFLRDEIGKEFDPLIARFAGALRTALPGIPPRELFGRMHFTLGSLFYTAARHHDLERISQGLLRGDQLDECIHQLVDFCAAGFEASTSSSPT
jgi:AcrR family transcriptional regulator